MSNHHICFYQEIRIWILFEWQKCLFKSCASMVDHYSTMVCHSISRITQKRKYQGGWVVSAPDRITRPGFKSCWRMHCTHDCMALQSMEPFIFTLPLSRYDLNNVERDVTHQILFNTNGIQIHISRKTIFWIPFECSCCNCVTSRFVFVRVPIA